MYLVVRKIQLLRSTEAKSKLSFIYVQHENTDSKAILMYYNINFPKVKANKRISGGIRQELCFNDIVKNILSWGLYFFGYVL